MHDELQSASKLTARDVRTLGLWILAGVIGATVAFQYFFAAFPEAAVDFRVTREQAVTRARDLLAELDYPVGDYESSVVFQVDDNAKTYLEREVGLQLANQLTAREINAWWWDVRFFRPQQQEEFRVQVDPEGRIVGLRHVVEEAREGAQLEQDAARALAEALLRDRLRFDLAAYQYLPGEANSVERPKRRDWTFTWERRIAALEELGKDAPYRATVNVQGDRADGYGERLKVPEAWERDYERLRSTNLFFQLLAQIPWGFLIGGALLILYGMARRGQVRWGGALRLGLVLTGLFLVMFLNQWPIDRHGYDTNSSYTGFLVLSMALAVGASLFYAFLATLSVAAGEPLYRADHPEKLRLGAAFSPSTWRDGLRSKEFFMAAVIGLALAAAHIGFVVVFYLAGKSIGFWSPAEIQYTDVVSTAIPWIYPLAISIYAATSEEFMFRLFAIPLLLRMTNSKWVAVLLPAFIWGFLHSAYPQQPGWVRGVEVGIIGVVAGWVMLRWGILATLVWHYTVDALLIGLILLRSESLYFQVSGGVVTALTLFPLLFAVGAYVARGGFATGEELLNRSAPVEVEEPEAETPPLTPSAVAVDAVPEPATLARPLSTGMIALLTAAAIGGAATLMYKPDRVGDHVQFTLNRQQAQERADQILSARGVDLSTYYRAAVIVDTYSGTDIEFLRRQMGMMETRAFYRSQMPSVFWRVRYFRDSATSKEGYAIILRPDGTLHSIHHDLDEAAPGANLSKEEAQARAEAWLLEARMLDLSQWKLVEAKSDKQPKRVDHEFTWEAIAPIAPASPPAYDAASASPAAAENEAGAAHVRFVVKVQGEEVSGYRTFVKIPQEWEREHTKMTLPWISYQVARGLFLLGWVIGVLVLFFRKLREVKVPWARLSRWALWGALVLVINAANSIPQLMANYISEFAWSRYIALVVISQFLAIGVVYSGLFLMFGFAWFMLSRCFGEGRLPGWRGMPGWYYRDALLLSIGGLGAVAAAGIFAGWADRFWPTLKASVGAQSFEALQGLWPAVQIVCGAILSGLLITGVVAVVGGTFQSLGGAWRSRGAGRALQSGLLVLLALAMIGSWGSPGDYTKQAVLELAFIAFFAWGVGWVFRFNLLGYFIFGALGQLIEGAVELLQQPEAFLRWNGYLVVGTAVLFLIWPMVEWARANASGGSSGGGSTGGGELTQTG